MNWGSIENGTKKLKRFSRALLTHTLCLSITFYPLAPSFALNNNALLSGGVVSSGSADFDYTTPNQLHVQQNSDRAVIDWDNRCSGKYNNQWSDYRDGRR